jgi:hypothetical protein
VPPDIAGDGPRVLERSEMADVVVSDQLSSGQGLGERWSHSRRVRARFVVSDRYGDGSREVRDRAEFDVATVLEHRGFDLGKTLQADPAIRRVGETVVDVASEKAGVDLVERWPAGVSVQNLGARFELDAPASCGIAHHVLAFRGEVVGEDDRLEEEQRGEQLRHVSFGE